jgi:hypothetical protein
MAAIFSYLAQHVSDSSRGMKETEEKYEGNFDSSVNGRGNVQNFEESGRR